MRHAQDGFWVIYHHDEAIGEIKGIDQANWLVDRLKEKHGGQGFHHATYATSKPSFAGKDKTHELMAGKPKAQERLEPVADAARETRTNARRS